MTLSAPAATTLAATGLGPTSATLAGTANPSGAPTTYHFEWGASTAYGQLAPAHPAAVGSDSADHAVAQTLTGLAPNTTYHYRLVTSSPGGTTDGADMTFVTPAQPSALSTTTPPLSPTTPPSPTGPPPAPPVVGRTAVAGVVSGTVLVRLPGSSRLVPLGPDQTIPLGATVNASHGVVKVTNALDRQGDTQSATVWAGSFSMSQARANGMTTFKVAGAPACPRRRPGAVRAAAASRRAPAKLWSKDNHGRYSTRGRNSVATVRGTIWETVETCAGTRTVVKRGTVYVRDLHPHRTVLVRAGHSHLAKP